MSRMIRTSFGTARTDCGDDDDEDEQQRISPTSVIDLDLVEAPVVAKRERSFLPGRGKAKNNDVVAANNNSNDAMINQLKRQVTTLEHEKASLEQELLNQINTVVFDKETMVGTLQEKLMESEKRFKEERQAHAETKGGIRQQRLSSYGDAKFEILRLQEEVQELSTTNETLRREIEQLSVDREKDNEQFLSQYNITKKQFQSEIDSLKAESEARLKEMEQTHVLAIADLERDMFERNQQQRKDADKQLQAETTKTRALEEKLKEKESTANNQALISSLKKSNNELHSQIAEMNSQLLKEQANNFDLEALLEGSKAEANEAINVLTTELEDLKVSLSKTEAEHLDLLEILELHEETTVSAAELEVAQEEVASLSKKLQLSASENKHLRDRVEEQKALETEVTALREELSVSEEELSKSEAENERLSVTLQRQKRTVADLRDAVDNLQQKEGNQVSNQVSVLEEKCQQQDEELSRLRNDCARRDEELEHLWERLDVERVANDELKDALETKALQQSTLECTQNDNDAKISALEQKCAEQQEEIDMITILLDEEKASNAAIVKNLEALEQINSALSAAEEGSHSAAQAENDTLTGEINELRAKLAESEASNEATKAAMETRNEKLCTSRKQLEDLMSSLQKEMDRAHEQNEDFRQQMNKMQCKSKDLVKQIDAAKSTELSLRLELEDERYANSEVQTTLEDRNNALRELEDQVQQLQEEAAQEQDAIATLRNTLGEEETSHSLLQEQYKSACTSLNDLEGKLREQRKSFATLVSTLHGEDNGDAQLQTPHDEFEAAETEQQHDESGLVGRIESITQDLVHGQKSIQAFQRSLEEKGFTFSKAEALRVCVAREQAANTELQQMLKSQESRIEEFNSSQSCAKLATADFEVDRVALLNRIGSLKEEVEELQSANQSLQSHFDDLQASQEQKDERLTAQEKDITLLRDKGRRLRTQVQAHARELNISKASLLGSQRARAVLESEHGLIVEQLHEKSKQLETAVASYLEMESSLDARSAELEESNEKSAELSCELLAVRKQTDVLEGSLSSITSQLESEQTEKASLLSSLECVRNENVECRSMVDNMIDSLLEAEGVTRDLSNQLQRMSDNQAGNTTTTTEDQVQGSMESFAQESSHGATISPIEKTDRENEQADEESTTTGDDPFDSHYLKNSLACLEEENLELRQALSDHLKVRNIVVQLEADKQGLLGEIKDLQDQLQQKLATSSDMNQSLEEQQMESIVMATLDEQTTREDAILVLHKEREALKSMIGVLQDQLADAQANDQSRGHRDRGVPTNIALEHSHEHSDNETGSASLTEEEVAACSPANGACPCGGDIDALKQENSQLRDQLKSLQFGKCGEQDGETTRVSCGDKQFENECRPFDEDVSLQIKATDLKEDQAEETAKKLSLLESTLEEEKALRQQAETSCHDQKETITSLETELLKTQSTSEEEKAQRQQAETTYHAQKATIATLETELSKTQSEVAGLEEQLETLQQNVNDEARKDSAKWERLNEELEQTKVWLEKGLDEVEGLRGQLSKTTQLWQDEEMKNQKLRSQMEQLESELFDSKKSLEINLEEAERLQDCLTTSEEENEERRQLLESFKAAAEHWRGEADKLKVLKDKTIATHMERESKLKQAYKREVGEYKLRVEEFEQRLLEENEKLRAESASVKESSDGSVEKVNHLSSQLVLAKQRLEEVEREKEALAERLKVEASTAQQSLEAAEARCRVLRERSDNETSSVQQQLNSIKKEEQEVRQGLEAQLREAKQQVKSIQKERAAMQERLDDFEANKMEKMLLDIEEQKEINKIKVDLTVERDMVAKCKAEIQKLRSAVSDLEVKCAVGASQVDELQSLRAELKRLQRKCEEAVAQATEAQASADRAEEARKVDHARALSSQALSVSHQQLSEEVEELKKELKTTQLHKIDLETRCKEKILTLTQQHSLQLKEKTKEITQLRDFICDGEDSFHSREDLLAEIKELREQTIVQGRINHSLQNKIEVLQQGREKFFEAKRKEIMRDQGEHQNLQRENTRLRERVVQVTKERKALQAQLESFEYSLGTSMTIHGLAPS